jgi:hypothetical protein
MSHVSSDRNRLSDGCENHQNRLSDEQLCLNMYYLRFEILITG